MKTTILLAAHLFLGVFINGQKSDNIPDKSQLLTVNPARSPKNTNGINVGILDSYDKQKINGLNFQLNPISLIYLLAPKVIEVPKDGNETVSINGLHLSTGGLIDGKKLNGIGISVYHIAQQTNGITCNFFNNNSSKLNGLHISGLNNSTENGNGLLIAISNNADQFNGLQIGFINEVKSGKALQIGIANKSDQMKGLQIGLINKNKNGRNFQVGFWNKNSKRTLPLINF